MRGAELANYPDGCDVHPHCLECPLPECKYDMPSGYVQWKNGQRNEKIVEAIEARGLIVKDVAEEFGLSERTIMRIVARYRNEDVSNDGHEG